MVLRLSRRVGAARTIDLGYDVTVSHRAFGYADWREAEATAMRLARQTLPAELAFAAECSDEEDLGPEYEEALRGQAAQHLVKLLLVRFGDGWTGVEGPDGAPAPLTAETLDQFLELFPGVAGTLHASLLAPWVEVAREGNVSAPSQDTATAEG